MELRFKTGEPVSPYNNDPVSRLLHPVVLAQVANAGLEDRRIVGALLLVMALELDDKGDTSAASLARAVGSAIRP